MRHYGVQIPKAGISSQFDIILILIIIKKISIKILRQVFCFDNA